MTIRNISCIVWVDEDCFLARIKAAIPQTRAKTPGNIASLKIGRTDNIALKIAVTKPKMMTVFFIIYLIF